MRRVGDQPTKGGKVRRWMRLHADALAIFAMTSLMLLGVYQLGQQQDQRRGDVDVAACERGNVLREYLSLDNRQSVLVLRASLRPSSVSDLSVAERAVRESSLLRRIDAQRNLSPYPCASLR